MTTTTESPASNAASTQKAGGNSQSITPDISPVPTTDAVVPGVDNCEGKSIKRTAKIRSGDSRLLYRPISNKTNNTKNEYK